MKTDMIVSCPKCGVENTVTMEPQDRHGLIAIIEMAMPEVKQYSFCGKTKCACGELVFATLTVTAGTNNFEKIQEAV